MTEHHLRALRIPKVSNQEALRKAYLKRARETHPDKNGRASDFLAVKEAYDFLKENLKPEKKRRLVREQYSPDIHLCLGLSLKEVYSGGAPKKIEYTRKQICFSCKGYGFLGTKICFECDGEQFSQIKDAVLVAYEKSCFTGTKFVFEKKSHDLGPDFHRGSVIVTIFEIIGSANFERVGSNLVHYISRPFAAFARQGVENIELPSGQKIRFRRRAFSLHKNQQFFVRRVEIDGAGFFGGKLIVILCATTSEDFNVVEICRNLIGAGGLEKIPKAYSLVR